jgi:hypothetical protein
MGNDKTEGEKETFLNNAGKTNSVHTRTGYAAATVRLSAAACSSFFTWMERRRAGIKNPFRGTKARPGKQAVKKTEIPTAGEVKKIIGALFPREAAAAAAGVSVCPGRAWALMNL